MRVLQILAEVAFWLVIATFVAQLAAILAARSIRWMSGRFKTKYQEPDLSSKIDD